MAGSESGQLGKRKATTEHFAGGPSSWRGSEEESGGEDPLMVLGSEIMTMILGKLDMRSVAVARLVSRGWQAIASSDRIWAPKRPSYCNVVCNLIVGSTLSDSTIGVPNFRRALPKFYIAEL